MADKTNGTSKSESVDPDIQEYMKHPLWAEFRKVYEKECQVMPEKSQVPILVGHYWRTFLAGVETGKQYEKSKGAV